LQLALGRCKILNLEKVVNFYFNYAIIIKQRGPAVSIRRIALALAAPGVKGGWKASARVRGMVPKRPWRERFEIETRFRKERGSAWTGHIRGWASRPRGLWLGRASC
jgi:transposase